ncbi:hypothetical protein JOC74_003759 [Bacillus capparidis]|uniref:Uncharacterized protein n=1 Tax=Bacillus capparidis TaxID=1840411 RepID=A0ABS4D0X5_9BACI|nr:hypothetical protein [Bacillus capparidis]
MYISLFCKFFWVKSMVSEEQIKHTYEEGDKKDKTITYGFPDYKSWLCNGYYYHLFFTK